jgi:Tfp pilus assembly protein PilF
MVRFFHTRYQEAKNLLYQGRYAEAAEAFETALRFDPLNNSLWQSLGTARREAGQLDDAAAAFREALRLQPGSLRSWNGWGRTLLLQGEADSAAWAHEQARRLLPASPEPWMGLGDVHARRRQYRAAAAAYDSALARGGSAVHLRGLLARIHRDALRDSLAAELHLREYARLRGLDPRLAAEQLPPLP